MAIGADVALSLTTLNLHIRKNAILKLRRGHFKGSYMSYNKILIPTDGSPIANSAVRAGVEFAKESNAEIVGVYVAPEYSYHLYSETVPPMFMTIEEYQNSARQVGEAKLAELREAAAGAGLKYSETIIFSDSPAKQIVGTAEKDHCDLIFMGSHGRGGLGQLLLGSVTSKVLSLCQIPVLVHRAKQEARS